jgi:hypothetical protein
VGERLGIDQEPAIVPIVAGPAPLPEVWRQAACKPGSVPGRSRGTAIPLGCPSPDTSRDLPGRPARERACTAPCGRAVVPTWSCSRWGLPCLSRCRPSGALLPPRFTLARRSEDPGGRYAFCGTFPEVALAGRYPAPCSRGARTFLPRVAAGAAVQPPVTASQLIAPRARSKATTSSSRRWVSSSARPSGRRCRNRRWKATRDCRRDTPCSSSG